MEEEKRREGVGTISFYFSGQPKSFHIFDLVAEQVATFGTANLYVLGPRAMVSLGAGSEEDSIRN